MYESKKETHWINVYTKSWKNIKPRKMLLGILRKFVGAINPHALNVGVIVRSRIKRKKVNIVWVLPCLFQCFNRDTLGAKQG